MELFEKEKLYGKPDKNYDLSKNIFTSFINQVAGNSEFRMLFEKSSVKPAKTMVLIITDV